MLVEGGIDKGKIFGDYVLDFLWEFFIEFFIVEMFIFVLWLV